MADGSDGRGTGKPALLPACIETLAIVAVFAAAGCWPVPDLNETVYLTKARHAADHAFGRGDFFLETPDAHGVFFLVMGPLAAALPLEWATWIGRLAGWMALAVGFRHLALPLLGPPGAAGAWGRVVAAALFALALEHTPAAGEWVIGGCEAKVFAWALVLGGLGEVVRGRAGPACLLFGGATACHPIVGVWAAVAAATAWRLAPPPPGSGGSGRDHDASPALAAGVAALALAGLALAAAGVVPAIRLSAGADAVTRAEAARIYVVERLPHHLLPRTFAVGLVARHVLAIVAWWLATRLAPPSAARSRLTTFTLAAIGIALVGLGIATLEAWAPTAAYGLLRYYWFRLADVAVPLALALTVAALVVDDAACRRLLPLEPRLARGMVTLVLVIVVAAESRHWPLPGRDLPPRGTSRTETAEWIDVCGWARENVPPGTCVLTPRNVASFTWRTGLPEVVGWKNSPQDAASLVAWRRRITDCYSGDGSLRGMAISTATLGEERMRSVARTYGARLAIVPLDAPGLAELPFQRLHANAGYAVLDLGD